MKIDSVIYNSVVYIYNYSDYKKFQYILEFLRKAKLKNVRKPPLPYIQRAGGVYVWNVIQSAANLVQLFI